MMLSCTIVCQYPRVHELGRQRLLQHRVPVEGQVVLDHSVGHLGDIRVGISLQK